MAEFSFISKGNGHLKIRDSSLDIKEAKSNVPTHETEKREGKFLTGVTGQGVPLCVPWHLTSHTAGGAAAMLETILCLIIF